LPSCHGLGLGGRQAGTDLIKLPMCNQSAASEQIWLRGHPAGWGGPVGALPPSAPAPRPSGCSAVRAGGSMPGAGDGAPRVLAPRGLRDASGPEGLGRAVGAGAGRAAPRGQERRPAASPRPAGQRDTLQLAPKDKQPASTSRRCRNSPARRRERWRASSEGCAQTSPIPHAGRAARVGKLSTTPSAPSTHPGESSAGHPGQAKRPRQGCPLHPSECRRARQPLTAATRGTELLAATALAEAVFRHHVQVKNPPVTGGRTSGWPGRQDLPLLCHCRSRRDRS